LKRNEGGMWIIICRIRFRILLWSVKIVMMRWEEEGEEVLKLRLGLLFFFCDFYVLGKIGK
jgi:hypothetical protein